MSSEAIALGERIIQLLDQGSFNTTYKYAVLLGLLDLCLEQTAPDGTPPSELTTRQLAEKVTELYWGATPCATPTVRANRRCSVSTAVLQIPRLKSCAASRSFA